MVKLCLKESCFICGLYYLAPPPPPLSGVEGLGHCSPVLLSRRKAAAAPFLCLQQNCWHLPRSHRIWGRTDSDIPLTFNRVKIPVALEGSWCLILISIHTLTSLNNSYAVSCFYFQASTVVYVRCCAWQRLRPARQWGL